MLALALTVLIALGSGRLSPTLDPDPGSDQGPGLPKEACGGRQGWVGDGEEGRDPPPCEEPDADGGDDPAGLHEPDWLQSGEDGDAGG
jgi:hypothetical protein